MSRAGRSRVILTSCRSVLAPEPNFLVCLSTFKRYMDFVEAVSDARTRVQDVVVSSDGQFALSASWDGTLRLWDLNTGTTTRQFYGHTKDVLSVAFSVDNRQIISGSRDKVHKCCWL